MINIDIKIILSFLLLVLVSCSDNSTGSDNGALGEMTLKVTGDFEAERSGQADFHGLDSGSIYMWEIHGNDYSPQTFSLSFLHNSVESIDRPGPGTYDVKNQVGQTPWGDPEPMAFTAIYTHIENENYAGSVEYSTLLCTEQFPSGGTLTITSSSDEEISGSFQFTAHNVEIEDTGTCISHGTIHVSGSFDALPRRSLQ